MARMIALLCLVVITLSGCAGNQPRQSAQTPDPRKQDMIDELTSDIITAKLKENGTSLICEQPSYQNCFQISAQQCYRETNPYKEQCFNRAMQKTPDTGGKEGVRQLFGHYFVCIASKNLANHTDRMKEIGACLKTARFDTDLGMKHLFKVNK